MTMMDVTVRWALPAVTLVAFAAVVWWMSRPVPVAPRAEGSGGPGGQHWPPGSPEPYEGLAPREGLASRQRPVATVVDTCRPLRVRHELRPAAEGMPVPVSPTRPLEVGRGRQAGLLLDDVSVSARHARIRCVGDYAVVEDRGSTNGTTVNGRPVLGATRLNSGDELRFGGAGGPRFRYRCVAAWAGSDAEVTA